jgi:uncharacterized protein YgiB involved in biofilm formation|tara:strand:- start:91739 stop:92296 length:558 start_codon:yes stop_codon:yes gene_type:complete
MNAQHNNNTGSNIFKRAGNAFDKWLDTGSTTRRRLKSFSAFTVAVAFVGGVVYGVTNEERQDTQDVINALNSQDTIVFNSHQDCMNKGYDAPSCAASQENAISLTDAFRDPVNAMDFQSCIDTYGTCPDRHKQHTGGFKVDLYKYKPVLSSWQATTNDITKSAPLYKLADAGEYLRVDGQSIQYN